MAVNTLYIDLENSAGIRQGNGPITSASTWRYTARMDAAGDFAFELPANDPKASLVQKKRIARAYAFLGSARVEVGAGIIDVIEREPGEDGSVVLRVSGSDLIRELTYRSVLGLKLYSGGNPVTHAAALAAVGTYAPAGWILTPDPSPPSNSVYGYFNGDTVLAGLIKTAEKSQTHFYRGVGRNLIFGSSFSSSGMRAIQAKGDLSATTCAITSLVEKADLYDLITRIYPRGSGNAEAQLTLRATTRTAPAGYTLDKVNNYLEYNAATAAYGRIERQVDFREIGPIENTTPDVIAASNMLFDTALEYLKRASIELDQATYTLGLASCSALLRPMQTIRVAYRDLDAGLNINADLNILESTWEITQDEIGTTALVVSNVDEWPASDTSVMVGTIAEGKVYQALPQLNANSYVTAYQKNIDEDFGASFRFRFGKEVTQLQSVLFEFQTLPFESTIKTIGSSTGGSGEVTTGNPSINNSGAPNNNLSGGASGNTGASAGNTSDATGNTSSASGSTGTTSGSTNVVSGGTDPTSGATNSPTGSTNLLTGGTNSPTGNTNAPSGGTSGEALVTDAPAGGDTDTSGFHQHTFSVVAGAGSHGPVELHFSTTIGGYILSAPFVTGSAQIFVQPGGNHVHFVNAHTHTVDAHSHSVNAHSHTVNAHEHTVDAHSHTVNAHSHTVNAHSHTIDDHSHTVGAHNHTLGNHNHTLGGHNHDLGSHTHSLNSHYHSLNNHVHDLEGGLQAIYGIYRAALAQTFSYTSLEYRVNSGAWLSAASSVDAGNGWRRLDITALVMHAETFRPLQENNILEMRALGSGSAYAIGTWSLSPGNPISISFNTNFEIVVGDIVDVAGAAVGVTTDINGENYAVVDVFHATPASSGGFIQLATSLSAYESVTTPGGTVTVHGSATIDAQLSVRNIIQAIAYN